MSSSTTGAESRPAFRPKLSKIETDRRSKLHAVLRDVRALLDAMEEEARAVAIAGVAPLVALAVAEIAVLDRETRANVDHVIGVYANLIAFSLGMEDSLWDAAALWLKTSQAPLAAFEKAWAAHMVRAERESESRHLHQKLINLDIISTSLGLTRVRMREVFGNRGCSLKPIRATASPFTPNERAAIRALAQRTGRTPERIRDLALSETPEAFSIRMMAREPILARDILDSVRLPNQSDYIAEKSIERYGRHFEGRATSRPGPKPRADTIERQIEAVAVHHGKSPKTIERWRRNLKTLRLVEEATKIPDSHVMVRGNSRQDEGEFTRSVIPVFSASLSPESVVVRFGIKGVEISDPYLLEIAQDRSYGKRRKSHKTLYIEKDLVCDWWEATRGEKPKDARIWKWAERKHLRGYIEAARQWKREMEIQARDDVEADRSVELYVSFDNEDTEVSAARPLRNVDPDPDQPRSSHEARQASTDV